MIGFVFCFAVSIFTKLNVSQDWYRVNTFSIFLKKLLIFVALTGLCGLLYFVPKVESESASYCYKMIIPVALFGILGFGLFP